MRIIGGRFKGRKLFSVPGARTRPTGGKLREALFDILPRSLDGARTLDLYAGTGAFGLEALSRGAAHAVFIDTDVRAVSTIQKNIRMLGVEKQTRCIRWNIAKNLKCIQPAQSRFDLVFMDPPYERGVILESLRHLLISQCLAPGALVVVEYGIKSRFPEVLPAAFATAERRKYGKSLVAFLDYMIGEATLS